MAQSHTPMSVMDAINQRCLVRAFKPPTVDRTTIHVLLAAAVRAPTAVHEEPWAFAIIRTRTRCNVSDRAKPLFVAEVHRAHLDRGGHAITIFEQPAFNIFYDAGTLAAGAMGLGSCVIGSALPALNSPEWKAEIGIPDGFTVIAPIIVSTERRDTEHAAEGAADSCPEITSAR